MRDMQQHTRLENGEKEPQIPLVHLIVDQELINKYGVLVDAARLGIDDVTDMMFHSPTKWFDPNNPDLVIGADKTIDQLLEESKIYNPNVQSNQVLFDKLYDKMSYFLDLQGNIHNFILTARDMTTYNNGERLNFALGASLDNVTVQSLYEYIMAVGQHSDEEIIDAVRLIARHEYGHMIGLVNKETITERGPWGEYDSIIYKGHCDNVPCTMQQINSTDEAFKLSQELLNKSDAGFCPNCANYIKIKGL